MRSTGIRTGELVAAASGVLLLLFMFLTWFEPQASDAARDAAAAAGADVSASAWEAFALTDLLMLVLALAGIGLAAIALAGVNFALRVAASVVATPLAAAIAVVVIYRTLLNQPQDDDLLELGVGAYLGVIAALGVLVGAFLSLSDESAPDAPEPEIATQPAPPRSA